MALVDYSDSDSEAEIKAVTAIASKDRRREKGALVDLPAPHPVSKRKIETEEESRAKSPPPLPKAFHSLYSTNVRTSTSDDPILHGGRKRQTPHVQGNWPAHVYLEWFPDKAELDSLDAIISTAQTPFGTSARIGTGGQQTVQTFLRSSLGAQLPLHISLSASLILSTAAKDDFQSRLRSQLAASRIHKFSVVATGLDWVPNFEKSRYFLILRLSKPEGDELQRALRTCNNVCGQFKLPQLYMDSSRVCVKTGTRSSGQGISAIRDNSNAFHISIAWTLEPPSDRAKDLTREMSVGALRERPISFQSVKVKVGNVVDDYVLK